ncbi:hypothetical protein GCM10012287_53090 [Streptomyces daqingensis]|uniref:Uncharacterized protein n=1 Tax=Streptomyces daqingensis TaxID=1472640 RepID=A0ABQ2MRQ5_9ACTN|nr:hypothetical protein GCM10012287_53090 [Streptomyces daqingensis]
MALSGPPTPTTSRFWAQPRVGVAITMEVEAVTPAPKPERDDAPTRSPKPVRCAHPAIKKRDGKICCADCGVQLYL